MLEIFWTFVEILFRFNVISIRKRQVFFYIKYIKYGLIIFEPVVNRRARKTNEYIFAVSSARGQLSAWLHQSLFRRRANVLLVENLATRRVSTPKSFDRFSPIRENLFSNIRISLSKHGTILKSKRLIGRNSKSFFGRGDLPAYNFFRIYVLPWAEIARQRGYLRDFFSRGESKRAQRGISFTKGTRKTGFFFSFSLSLSPSIFSSKRWKKYPRAFVPFRFVSWLFRGSFSSTVPVKSSFCAGAPSISRPVFLHRRELRDPLSRLPFLSWTRRKWGDDVSSRQKEMGWERKKASARNDLRCSLLRLFRESPARRIAILSYPIEERSVLYAISFRVI